MLAVVIMMVAVRNRKAFAQRSRRLGHSIAINTVVIGLLPESCAAARHRDPKDGNCTGRCRYNVRIANNDCSTDLCRLLVLMMSYE